MPTQNITLCKTLNHYPSPSQFPNPLHKFLPPIHISHIKYHKLLRIHSLFENSTPPFPPQDAPQRGNVRSFAGRSKKNVGGRLESIAEVSREAERNARKQGRKMADNLFYRQKNPNKNYPDNFTEEELQMIGLGYDRMVRFMKKDDPNLRHPYDWYKYGQFGPYSWRGVVLGDPIRGNISDERVSMIGEVKDQEEWEKIEQFEMDQEFGNRLNSMDSDAGLKYYWIFVRHPKWRVSDLPWQQWTLVCEVVVEAGKQRLDKWNLMGRLGNKTRAQITQCAAWMRPDVIYVRRPVYQCRFEPQNEFFKELSPLLNPETEQDFLCELEDDDGNVDLCTYFGGLCKIVKVNPKAFVDDVVKGFEKLSEEKRSKCLEFLLGNHPVKLLHPYTKEWKAKLEEMELGCDAPDDDDHGGDGSEKEIVDWIEDDGDDDDSDDVVVDMEGDGDVDDELGVAEEEDLSSEENEKDWDEEFKKALNSNEAMESIVKQSIKMSDKMYRKQLESEEKRERINEDVDESTMRGVRAKVTPEEWKHVGYGPFRRRVKKSRIPPGLFLRAAVRTFTYKNLVKEIVLMRHAILEGEIGGTK